jgi:hypothetical protein
MGVGRAKLIALSPSAVLMTIPIQATTTRWLARKLIWLVEMGPIPLFVG